MAEVIEKKYLDQAGLGHYDEKIKKVISDGDASTLKSAKDYADSLAGNYDAAGTAATKVKELADGAVKTNADAIAKLNGGVEVEGSVDKKVADAKAELEGKITASEYDDAEVRGLIQANTEAINAHKEVIDAKVTTLVGEDANKSVRTIANEELAAQLIPEGAKESLDTLQEIAAWIQKHPDDATAMNAAITALQTLVGTIPIGATASDIVGYIKELVDAEKDRATAAEGALDTRVKAVEGLIGEGGSVDDKIATAKSEAIAAAATDAQDKADKALADAKADAAEKYATVAQGAKADTALQKTDIATGTANGSIAVGGEDVAVKGLGTAAYEPKSAFEVAGAAKALEDGQVATNKADIAGLKTKVETLESTSYTAITTEEIDALFTIKAE